MANRLKERYNPRPTERERQFHIWLMDTFPCACGCGGQATVVHHVLGSHPAKRWRRDHAVVVPMTAEHHMKLHAMGSERLFDPDQDYGERAANFKQMAMELGKL